MKSLVSLLILLVASCLLSCGPKTFDPRTINGIYTNSATGIGITFYLSIKGQSLNGWVLFKGSKRPVAGTIRDEGDYSYAAKLSEVKENVDGCRPAYNFHIQCYPAEDFHNYQVEGYRIDTINGQPHREYFNLDKVWGGADDRRTADFNMSDRWADTIGEMTFTDCNDPTPGVYSRVLNAYYYSYASPRDTIGNLIPKSRISGHVYINDSQYRIVWKEWTATDSTISLMTQVTTDSGVFLKYGDRRFRQTQKIGIADPDYWSGTAATPQQ